MSGPQAAAVGATAVLPHKVAVAHEYVRRVNPWSDVATVAADLAALTPGCLASLDVALVAVDNERARYLATRRLRAVGVPYVDVGVRADLWIARATCIAAGVAEPCLVCGWTDEHLARAGVDAGMPCGAVIETGDGLPSTLVMGQAAAALAAREALCLAGVVREPVRAGCELRLDLRCGRLERFRLSLQARCASDHVLGGPRTVLDVTPANVALGDLLRAHGAGPETTIVLAASELASTAVCSRCGAVARLPARLDETQPGECPACHGRLIAVRRASRVRWGEIHERAAEMGGAAPAAALAEVPASRWFRRGDVFALEDDAGARVVAFAPVELPTERGIVWDDHALAARFIRLPPTFDLARIRATRLGLIGVGNVGAALLAQLAPLPWRSLLLVDRDTVEPHNLPAHALAASVGEAAR